jgi:hypothetical protein
MMEALTKFPSWPGAPEAPGFSYSVIPASEAMVLQRNFTQEDLNFWASSNKSR